MNYSYFTVKKKKSPLISPLAQSHLEAPALWCNYKALLLSVTHRRLDAVQVCCTVNKWWWWLNRVNMPATRSPLGYFRISCKALLSSQQHVDANILPPKGEGWLLGDAAVTCCDAQKNCWLLVLSFRFNRTGFCVYGLVTCMCCMFSRVFGCSSELQCLRVGVSLEGLMLRKKKCTIFILVLFGFKTHWPHCLLIAKVCIRIEIWVFWNRHW